MWIIPLAVIFVFSVYIFLIFPVKPRKEDSLIFTKRSYAHRGFHDNENGPSENSLEAFISAAKHGYGVELDVQLTEDKQPIVFHDSNLNRTSGIDKNIREINYEELKTIKIFNRDQIPLFIDVLDHYDRSLPIIIEIKSEGNREWVDEICRTTYELLKGYSGIYCIESFDPIAVGWFKKNAPHVIRGQLASHRKNYQGSTNPITAFLLQNLMLNFISRPHFIAYDHESDCFNLFLMKLFKAIIFRWTIKDEKRHHELEGVSDGLIFEGYTPNSIWK